MSLFDVTWDTLKKYEKDYFFPLLIASTAPITAAITTIAIIMQIRQLVEDGGGVVELTVIGMIKEGCVVFMEPVELEVLQPDGREMEQEYVPQGSWNVIVLLVDVSVVPFKVTDQDVPDGRPDSVNVTVKVIWENVIDCETGEPLTVNDPEDGFGEQLLFDDDTTYEYVPLGSLSDISVPVDIQD